MNNQVKTYYIPFNPNIKKGPIYTLYLNNNKNLDLTSILAEDALTLNNIITPFKENKIIIEEEIFNKLIQITKQINDQITNSLNYLNKLNTELQTNLSSLSNERKI